MLSTVALSLAFQLPHAPTAPHTGLTSSAATRCTLPRLQEVEIQPDEADKTSTVDLGIAWRETPSGFKYVEDTVGEGRLPEPEDVVQVHYTVSLLSTGTTLGSSRGKDPLVVCLGKHNVPIWDEALVGMRLGGKRRMLVPPEAIPERSQAAKVPGENRVLRFDFELVGEVDKSTFAGWVATNLPPFARRVEIGRNLYMLVWLASFVPYFLPMDMQPTWYHDGLTPQEIQERREQRALNNYIGGDISAIEGLFPPQ